MIYLIVTEDNKYCKIGYTSNIDSRLRVIQTSCPIKCNIISCIDGGYDLEASLHKEFSSFRSIGEWYHYSDDILSRFNGLSPSRLSVRIKYKGLMKNNFLFKADRVGVYRLLGYMLGTSNLKYTWSYSDDCLRACGINESTYKKYIKQIISMGVATKKGGIIYFNKELFHLSYK